MGGAHPRRLLHLSSAVLVVLSGIEGGHAALLGRADARRAIRLSRASQPFPPPHSELEEEAPSRSSRPPRLTPVSSAAHYRELLRAGVKYSHLDVRGNSSALAQADGRHGTPRALHPVAAAMHRRREEGSRPGARNDGFKIALAVEGGGMRGCVAAGMVAAIHHLNLTDSLDAVYGSSAGSLIGAYLLSRQDPRYGCSIYYEELPKAGRRFIDLRNVLRSLGLGALRVTPAGVSDLVQRRLGMPVLNLDQLLVEIVQRRKPLDFERLWACQRDQPLRVVASALTSECSVSLGAAEGAWASLPELAHCMRASMLLPGICGPVVPLNNSRGETEPHADAMLFEPVPYRLAIREGATHVLVLRTRPDGLNVVKRQSFVERLIAHRFFQRKMRMPHMYQHMRQQRHRQRYAEDILLLNEAAARLDPEEAVPLHWEEHRPGPTHDVRMLPVALQPGERGPEVSNLQTDAGEIFHAVRCGFARAYELLAPLTDAHGPEAPEAGRGGDSPVNTPMGKEAAGVAPRRVREAAVASPHAEGEAAEDAPEMSYLSSMGAVDGWAVAVQVFPDSILEDVREIIATEAKEKGKGVEQAKLAIDEEVDLASPEGEQPAAHVAPTAAMKSAPAMDSCLEEM